MGQRLAIACIKDDVRFAVLYFQWGAYTSAVYYIEKQIISGLTARGYSDDTSIDDTALMLLDILEKDFVTTGSAYSSDGKEMTCFKPKHGGIGMDTDENGRIIELPYWEKLGAKPLMEDVSRSEGLIYISQEMLNEIDKSPDICSYEVINFDSRTATNHNFARWHPEDVKEEYEIDTSDIEETDTDPFEDFKWEDLDSIMVKYAMIKEKLICGTFIGKEPVSGEIIQVYE